MEVCTYDSRLCCGTNVQTHFGNASFCDAVARCLAAGPTESGKARPERSSVWRKGGCLILIAAGALWRVRRQPYLLFGWLWFLGVLVPTIGFVQAGIQSRADRFTYIPGIGLWIGIIWLFWDLTMGLRARAVIRAGMA